jgi:hypothetical protein
LALQGCVGCREGAPQLVIELFFGRAGVSDAAWDSFLASVVTPRFPDGLTVFEARGQWHDPRDQRVSREPANVVQIAVPRDRYEPAKLAQVIEAYKTTFQQQSVGRLIAERCGGFY